MRTRKFKEPRRRQPPKEAYCKKLHHNEPINLSSISGFEGKCEVCISSLTDSLYFFEEMFRDIAIIGEEAVKWVDDVYNTIYKIESIIKYYEKNKTEDNILDLFQEMDENLREEADSLECALDRDITNFDIPNSDDKEIDEFLTSIYHKLESEMEFVRTVGYDLHSVLIGAA
jgi:hypothetical protein